MKKLLKIAAILAGILVVVLIAAFITLKIMFPAEKLQAMAQDYAKQALNREVTFSRVSFNLLGVTLRDLAVSERSTFQDGTFIKADKAVVKLAFWPLLKKRVEISTVGLTGLSVNIISGTDGKFNFDDLLSAEEATPEQPAQDTSSGAVSFDLLAQHIYAKNCSFYYKDLQNNMDASITNLNIDIRDFDLSRAFDAAIDFTTSYQDHSGMDVSVPVKIALKVDLASLDMQKAYVTLQNLSTSYKTIQVTLLGGVKDFTKPVLNLHGTISGVSNMALASIMPDLPHFVLPDITFNADATADLDASVLTLSRASLSVSDSALTAAGSAGWGGTAPTYTIQAGLDLDLSQLASMTNLMDGYGAGGNITGDLTATDKNDGQDVRGTLQLKDLTVQYPPVVISELDGTVHITSLSQIAIPSLNGKLNGESFTSSLSYKDLGTVMDIVFKLDLSKLTLDSFGPAAESTDTAAANTSASAAATEPEMFFNVNANVNIGPISVPYFTSQGATLTANLKQASPSMKQANGTVAFTLQEGAIKDLGSFISGGKVVKILMLPLTLVKTVTSKLGVDIFPAKSEEEKGQIKVSSGSGTYVFTDGVMDLKETHFDSSLSKLNASGNINFKTEALNMKVSASVLTDQTPVIIKIGGTMSDPSGKLDVAGTAVSVVTGLLNYKTPVQAATSTAKTATQISTGTAKAVANVGTETAKTAVNAVKSIGSLFKKKSSDTEEK